MAQFRKNVSSMRSILKNIVDLVGLRKREASIALGLNNVYSCIVMINSIALGLNNVYSCIVMISSMALGLKKFIRAS